MSYLGGLITAMGIFLLLIALSKDTSVPVPKTSNTYGIEMPERVVNLQLMNEKQNDIIIASLVVIVGVVIILFGFKKDDDKKNVYSKENIDKIDNDDD